MTPLEKYERTIGRLNILHNTFIGKMRLLGTEAYGRAVRAARAELEGHRVAARVGEATEVGRGISVAAMGGGTSVEDLQLREQKRTNEILERIESNARQGQLEGTLR